MPGSSTISTCRHDFAMAIWGQLPIGGDAAILYPAVMNPIILILILLLLFGGGCFYLGGPAFGGGGLGLVILIILIIYFVGGMRSKD